ncbi:C6 transcription factor [Histoplasma capsulatum]|uniref:C6 transcription factor n=1 Tax=Ajellomyces capsulatus TaxID=5037 RepID=A0A8A1MB48_AJECA|nr:C6 transcription factor [Histoplasma capsulatum]
MAVPPQNPWIRRLWHSWIKGFCVVTTSSQRQAPMIVMRAWLIFTTLFSTNPIQFSPLPTYYISFPRSHYV